MAERALGRGALLRLAKEIGDELCVAERIADELAGDAVRLRGLRAGSQAEPDAERGTTAVVALGLHRWYSAIEATLERVERAFGTLPSGPEWHTDLLLGATTEIPEVRPAILPLEQRSALRDLLKFRHFLRHAYAVELEAKRLLVLAAQVDAARPAVAAGLTAFREALIAMARALTD